MNLGNGKPWKEIVSTVEVFEALGFSDTCAFHLAIGMPHLVNWEKY